MKDQRFYLIDILECAERILAYTKQGRGEFIASGMVRDAVVRNFEVIGEAAKRVSEGTRKTLPSIPWKKLAGYRDVLIHNYDAVDVELTWNIIERDVPALVEVLRAAAGPLDKKP